MARDPYAVLGVAKGASEAEVKSAYRKLAKQLHPDRTKNDAKAADRFKEVATAYGILGEAESRAKFDRGEIDGDGNARAPAGFGGGPGGFTSGFGGPGGATYSTQFGGGDPSDLFSELFSGRGAGGFGQRAARKAADTAYKLSVPFVAAARLDPQRVGLSNGRTLDLKLPPGFESGAQVRLSGQGEAGPGAAGDALVTLDIDAHPFFTREGDDVRLNLPIRLDEAVLGAKVTTPTVDGPVAVSVPAGSTSGRVLRLRGKGFHRKTGGRGDQLVMLLVDLPADDAELRQFAEGWAAERAHNPRAALGV